MVCHAYVSIYCDDRSFLAPRTNWACTGLLEQHKMLFKTPSVFWNAHLQPYTIRAERWPGMRTCPYEAMTDVLDRHPQTGKGRGYLSSAYCFSRHLKTVGKRTCNHTPCPRRGEVNRCCGGHGEVKERTSGRWRAGKRSWGAGWKNVGVGGMGVTMRTKYEKRSVSDLSRRSCGQGGPTLFVRPPASRSAPGSPWRSEDQMRTQISLQRISPLPGPR